MPPSRVLAAGLLVAMVHAGASAWQAQPRASSPIELTPPRGPIAGTLLVPDGTGRVPVALIIAGSGPTDRDGNSALLPGKHDAYRLLAEALAAEGIASVRYDKRGVAASAVAGGREADMRFDTLVEDAAAWVATLRDDFRFTTITVIGHSEGSLIGMLAARAARADAFVSIAGPGRPAGHVIRGQLRTQLTSDPALLASAESILSSLEQGTSVADVPPPLAALFRPSVQPYLISWMKYDPAEELARLDTPRLIVQGTTDLQVAVADAKQLAAAAPEAELRIIEGMNHVLKTVTDPARQAASYVDPGLPLASDLAPAITGFIDDLDAPGRPRIRRPTTQRRSLRGVTMGQIDGVRIAIEYGRPSKRGRVIWGALVPWGRWWMPGADEASTLTTSAPLRIGTLTVPAGDYTIYTLPRQDAFTLIINEATNVFHTVYDPGRDLGHVPMTVTMQSGTPVEQLTFEITPRMGRGGQLELRWDDRGYAVEIARPD
jgi:pimeloyl-ACP methyl ester carboxylesterase